MPSSRSLPLSRQQATKVSQVKTSAPKTTQLMIANAVIPWDASSNSEAYEIFEKAILSDGGAAAQKNRELSGEPLIEGMLVGTSKNLLTTAESHQVR